MARVTKRTREILERFDEQYTREYKCYLNHSNAGQLLIATMLSAQCTDIRVNIVTETLFKKYPTMESFAKADLAELEMDIKPTGFYHNKAKNIIGTANRVLHEFGGEIPSGIDDLTSLPGVGRKTANVIRGNIFGEPSIVVDTHVKRISKKLGLAKSDDPEKIEFELMEVLPKEHWILYNIQVITFGREICFARSPKCEQCFLTKYCQWVRGE